MPRLAAFLTALVLTSGCAGDLGADDLGLPRCSARPVVPPGFEVTSSEEVELEDRLGTFEELRDGRGRRLEFHLGARMEAGLGLPRVGSLPLATTGSGRLHGDGGDWMLAWEYEFPCSEMAIVGSGFDQRSFTRTLGFAQVIPFEAEEGAEEGAEEEELEELLEGGDQDGGAAPTGPAAEWVAVYGTSLDPAELRATADRLRAIPGATVEVAPASCWPSLARTLGVARPSHVVALVAPADFELDFAIGRVEETPLVRGVFRDRCTA